MVFYSLYRRGLITSKIQDCKTTYPSIRDKCVVQLIFLLQFSIKLRNIHDYFSSHGSIHLCPVIAHSLCHQYYSCDMKIMVLIIRRKNLSWSTLHWVLQGLWIRISCGEQITLSSKWSHISASIMYLLPLLIMVQKYRFK